MDQDRDAGHGEGSPSELIKKLQGLLELVSVAAQAEISQLSRRLGSCIRSLEILGCDTDAQDRQLRSIGDFLEDVSANTGAPMRFRLSYLPTDELKLLVISAAGGESLNDAIQLAAEARAKFGYVLDELRAIREVCQTGSSEPKVAPEVLSNTTSFSYRVIAKTDKNPPDSVPTKVYLTADRGWVVDPAAAQAYVLAEEALAASQVAYPPLGFTAYYEPFTPGSPENAARPN